MSVINVLPNGYLVVTLSPREAILLNDQILGPEEFPWQTSEGEMVALEVKGQIKNAMEQLQSANTDFLSQAVREIDERKKMEEQARRQQEEAARRQEE
jgi:hypothetical protein